MVAGFREAFVEADGFPRVRYKEAGKCEHAQGRERLQSAVSPVAPRPREGPLTEPTAGAQP